MKGQVAASAVAIASLAREGFEPAGDLIFAATADEEVGDGFGLAVARARRIPTPCAATTRSTRARGDRVELGGEPFYLCSTAEKMSSPFRLRVRGRSGHASMPGIADNALVKAAPLIERARRVRARAAARARGRGAPARGHRRAPAPRRRGARAARGDRPARGGAGRAAARRRPSSPTMIAASQKRNVIPALCEVTVDCRLLPGPDARPRREEIVRARARRGRLRARVDRGRRAARARRSTRRSGTRSRSFVAEARAGAQAGADLRGRLHRQPLAARGVRHGRVRLLPVRAMDAEVAARLIHSADERMPVDDLELGVQLAALRRATRGAGRNSTRGSLASSPWPRRRSGSAGWRSPNGVLVHGPTAWACASGTPDGELKVAARRKRLRAARVAEPAAARPGAAARGVGAPARRSGGALPEAKLPVRAPARAGRDARQRARSSGRARLAARSARSRRSSSADCSRSRRLRSRCASSELAAYHGAEHVSIGSYEHGEARDEGARALRLASLGPLLATTALGNALAAARAGALRAAPRGSALSSARSPRRPRSSAGWCAIPRPPLARALAKPGPRAPAPPRHRGADGGAARGRRGRARRVPRARAGQWPRRAGPHDAPSARGLRPPGREDARGLLHRRVLQPRARDAARRTAATRAS